MAFGLIGSPEQINVTSAPLAFESLSTQSGNGWVFYIPPSSNSALSGNLIAREISSAGVPSGNEIDLAVPAAQTGYQIYGAQGAVLADGSFIVSYVQDSTTAGNPLSAVSDVVHYSSTGAVLGSFVVDAFAKPQPTSGGGFQLLETGLGGTSEANAVIATYAETGTTPTSSTTVATAAAGQEIAVEDISTTAGVVLEEIVGGEASGQTSSLNITLPNQTTPLVFSAPVNTATVSSFVFSGNIVAASDGSFYTAIATSSESATTTSGSIAVYHIVSGTPELLTTISTSFAQGYNEAAVPLGSTIELLSNGDLAVEYSGATQTVASGPPGLTVNVGGVEEYVELLSPTGTQIGSTISLGVVPGGSGLSTPSNGNLATVVETSAGLSVEQLGFGSPGLGSIGSPQQVNVTAGAYTIEGLEGVTTQGGAGWVFYAPTASGLTGGNLIARDISASGVPTGSEVDLAIPAAQSGYTIMDAASAVLTDGTFIVGYQQFNSSVTGGSWETDVVHYSATGSVEDSFLVDTTAVPTALANGGFQLGELGFGGSTYMSANAVLATYAENGTTPSSTTTVATATAAGEAIAPAQYSTSAGTVSVEDVFTEFTAGLTSSVAITLPGATTPLLFSAPAANSATTAYSVWASQTAVASDGSYYLAVATDTTITSSDATSAQINLYHIVSGSPQLLTTISDASSVVGDELAVALLPNGDIAVEYAGAPQTTNTTGASIAQQYVELFSPTGTQIGSTLLLGYGLPGLDQLSNGNLATAVETSSGLSVEQLGFDGAAPAADTDDFTGSGTSDILLQNSAGTLVDWIVNNGAITAGNNLGTNAGWNPVGTGDFTGNGVSDILMQNASGTIVDWTMKNGVVSNAAIMGNTVGFNIVGTGDFTGNGTDDILLQNSAGTIVDWIVSNGAITAGNNLGTNPGWNVVGTGDFNGDGTTDLLLENSTGTVVDWTMGNGTVANAAVVGNASGYNIVGTGDFTGNGTADILLQNAAGDLVDWMMTNGAITGAHDLGVNAGWSVAAIGDYTGNGVSDILLTNAAGAVVDWTMGNGVVTNGVLVGNSAGFTVKH